jgi:hypothetical protein
LAAVRRLAYEAADAGLLSPELAAGIRRVKGIRKLGIRLGTGLLLKKLAGCGRRRTRIGSRASETVRFLGSCLNVGSEGESWLIWISGIYSSARNTGP